MQIGKRTSRNATGKREATDSNYELRSSQAKTFGEKLKLYMEELGLEQTRLAEMTGVSRPEISIWCSGKKRPPSWLDAGTLAWAIYGVMRERKGSGQPTSPKLTFDAFKLMKEFREAAGLQDDEFENQQVLSRLQSHQELHGGRTLRLGWFPWGTFARKKRPELSATASDNFGGLSEELCRRVAELLGVAMQPVPVELPEVGDKLEAREVDLVAPLILLPSRVLDFACSKPLAGLHVGLGMLAPTARRSLQFPDKSTPTLQPWKQIPWGKVRVFVVKGGVADILLTPHRGSVLVKECANFQEAWDAVRAEPIERTSNLVRVFMADTVSCHALQDHEFELVVETHHKLPVAFAVHRSETRLLAAINLCVDIIADDIKAAGFTHFENSPDIAGFKAIVKNTSSKH